MRFDEMGNMNGKTLMLLPGTACDYQTNFGAVLDRLGEKYHLICVNYAVSVRLQAIRYSGAGSVYRDYQEVFCEILPGDKGLQKLG